MKKYSILLVGSIYCMCSWGAQSDLVSGLNPDSWALFQENQTKKEIMGYLANAFADIVQDEVAQFSDGFIRNFITMDRSISVGQAHELMQQYTKDNVDRLLQELRAVQVNVVQEYYKRLYDQGYAVLWDVQDQNIVSFMKYSTAILNQGAQTLIDVSDKLYSDRMTELINVNLQKITSDVEKAAIKQAQDYLKAHHIKPETPQEEIQRVAQGLLKQTLKKLENEMKDELRKQAKMVFHSVETSVKQKVDASVKDAKKAAADAVKKSLTDALTGASTDGDIDEKEDTPEPVTA